MTTRILETEHHIFILSDEPCEPIRLDDVQFDNVTDKYGRSCYLFAVYRDGELWRNGERIDD